MAVKCTLGQLSYVQVILFLGVYSDLHILEFCVCVYVRVYVRMAWNAM